LFACFCLISIGKGSPIGSASSFQEVNVGIVSSGGQQVAPEASIKGSEYDIVLLPRDEKTVEPEEQKDTMVVQMSEEKVEIVAEKDIVLLPREDKKQRLSEDGAGEQQEIKDATDMKRKNSTHSASNEEKVESKDSDSKESPVSEIGSQGTKNTPPHADSTEEKTEAEDIGEYKDQDQQKDPNAIETEEKDRQSDSEISNDTAETSEIEKAVNASPESSSSDLKLVTNYLSLERGAKVVYSTEGTENALGICAGHEKDWYMISPCDRQTSVIIQLSEPIAIHSVRLANFEYYSSGVKTFQVYSHAPHVKPREWGEDDEGWEFLGEYEAENTLKAQRFRFGSPSRNAQFLKIRILTWHPGHGHPGHEVCTLSSIEAYGENEEAQLLREIKLHEAEMEKTRKERRRRKEVNLNDDSSTQFVNTNTDKEIASKGNDSLVEASNPTQKDSSNLNSDSFSTEEALNATVAEKWVECAKESDTCQFSGTKAVRFGAGQIWSIETLTGPIRCTLDVFEPDNGYENKDLRGALLALLETNEMVTCEILEGSSSQASLFNLASEAVAKPPGDNEDASSTKSSPSLDKDSQSMMNGNIDVASQSPESKLRSNSTEVKSGSSITKDKSSKEPNNGRRTPLQILAKKVSHLEIEQTEIKFELQEFRGEIETDIKAKFKAVESSKHLNYERLSKRLANLEETLKERQVKVERLESVTERISLHFFISLGVNVALFILFFVTLIRMNRAIPPSELRTDETDDGHSTKQFQRQNGITDWKDAETELFESKNFQIISKKEQGSCRFSCLVFLRLLALCWSIFFSLMTILLWLGILVVFSSGLLSNSVGSDDTVM